MRYIIQWQNQWLTADCSSLEEMENRLKDATKQLAEYREAGFLLDHQGGPDDYMNIYTYDKELARRFGALPEYTEEEGPPPEAA